MIIKLLAALPQARRWVDDQVDHHWPSARPVRDYGFSRLPDFFSPVLLESVRVAIVDEIPMPPLERWGVGAFQDLGAPVGKSAAGMTLRDFFFVRRGRENSESLFFHELIHAIQWNRLGANAFLGVYGMLLRKHGYNQNPLELMAYELQTRFNEHTNRPFEAEPIVIRRTDELAANFARHSFMNRAVLAALKLAR